MTALPVLPGLLSPLAPFPKFSHPAQQGRSAPGGRGAAATRRCPTPSCPSPLSLPGQAGWGPEHPGVSQRGSPGARTGSAATGVRVPRGGCPRHGGPRAHAWRWPVLLPPRGTQGPACGPVCQGDCCGQCPGAEGYPREPAVCPGQRGFELLIFGLICKRVNEIENNAAKSQLQRGGKSVVLRV